MGRHRAAEPEEKGPSRLVMVWVEHCQPFYKRYRKSIIAALGAAITALFSVWTNGITQEELTFILIQIGAAIGVWGVPNATNKKVVNKE